MDPVWILVALLSPLCCVSADIFSAIADLEKLLETQTAMVSEFPNYIEKEKSRIAHLERQLKVLEKEDIEARKDVSNYLENPLNAFRLIKRLTDDLYNEEKSSDTDAGSIIKYMRVTSPHLSFASREDLIGAARALVRLQNTYQLNVTELAEGRLQGAYSPMSSEDCFVVGLIIYEEADEEPASALPWLLEALRKFQDGDQPHDLTEVNILEYIAYSYYKVGDLKSAIDWTIKIAALDPKNSEVRKNLHFYIDSLIEDSEKLHVKKDTGEAMPNAAMESPLSPTFKPDQYEALCRGEFQPDRKITNKLFCWYSSLYHPFLVLAPIKVEQVYVEPDVYIFHQVISDTEIQHVKDLARPKFDRALVLGTDGSGPMAAQYRISKSSWLKDDESPIVARITQRIADMTGFSMASAEELQVANYGIGGQYEPHFDYSTTPEESFIEGSNRIATVLFYMSEVAQGGATVFTELGLSVFPIKNAALYWLNLHPSGEGDLSTRHAACPVLRGSKWVSNKWIHQIGQELIRPCTLEFQPGSMVRPNLKPLRKTFR